jgi:hypothetical protein
MDSTNDDPGMKRTGRRIARGSRGLAWCLAVVGFVLGAESAAARAIAQDLWGVDNTVAAFARSGNTLYVGGAFNWVGPSTGGLVALPKHSSMRVASFPRVTGYVVDVAADGHGGWFVSGKFTAIGGVPRYCLAHVLADGSIAPWNPNPNHVSYGTGGLLVSGNTVYVCGGFATIAGKPRQYIAALDGTTGEALDWDAHADGLVAPLAIHGNVLYVGGGFSHVGGKARQNIAALDAKTGNATSWNPAADGWVSAVSLWGKRVYAGGSFDHIGGKARTALAELDPETGLATDWNPILPVASSEVGAMDVHGGRLYFGGQFNGVDGESRHSLAAFDLRTGFLMDWNPPWRSVPNHVPIIYALKVDGRSIYVGGQFDHVGGKQRKYVAELDARTGEATDWDPDPNNDIFTIGVSEDQVLIGGWMKSVAMVPRHHLAAFDLSTGRVKDWNPNLDGVFVHALAVHRGRLYVGGAFWNAGGEPRSMLAALDTLTGAATDWKPDADDLVNAVLMRGDTVFVGGNFSHIGGQARDYLAALDANTGAALPWNPSPNDYVEALTSIGNTVYAGGWFTRMGGADRNSVAAVDAASGAVLPWQVDARAVVSSFATIGNTVYLGGPFDRVNGQARNGLAAVDGTTGALQPWDPNPVGPRESAWYTSVRALAAHGNTVFVGGDFTQIGGQAHASLAALDPVTGAALVWGPDPDQSVWALDATSDRLFAGGYFQAAAWTPHLAVMGVAFPALALAQRNALEVRDVEAGNRHEVTLEQVAPNPVRSSGVLRFSLPRAGPVSLTIYDLQGRRVAALLQHEVQEAGPHSVSIRTEAWRTGAYFVRLDAQGTVRTEKIVVLR